MNIVRFNWPLFAAAAAAILLTTAGSMVVTSTTWRVALALAAVGIAGGSLVSVAASHLIYDRSELYRFSWLPRAVDGRPIRHATFCQTGFDESSALVAQCTPDTIWTLLDHYDPAYMIESSIQRARRHCPPARGTLSARFDAWPTDDESADLVIGMLAVHELRNEHERVRWFDEARRTIRGDGRIVVVEHVRDLANSLVFGPGVLHFHTAESWRRSWSRAQLRQREELRITPWVRVFVLERE